MSGTVGVRGDEAKGGYVVAPSRTDDMAGYVLVPSRTYISDEEHGRLLRRFVEEHGPSLARLAGL